MRKVILFLSFALLLAAVPLAAQDEGLPDWLGHSECEVDLSGQTVTIYHFGDISGPYAFITQPLLAGLADALAWFNARGGVCGALLASDNRDTGGDLAQTQAAYDAYRSLSPRPAVMVLYASGDAELLREQVAQDEIAVIISAGSVEGLYGEDGQSPGWIFATNPLYADQFGMFCAYVGANPERFPNPTIGYISWPGAFGEAAYTPEAIAYCAEQGVTVLERPEYFPPTATDITTNVQNLVDAGANILYTNSLASGPALVAATVVLLGLEDEVTLAGVNWALDTSVALLGQRSQRESDGLPSVNGLIGSLPFYWWTELTQPGIQLINEQADANQRALQVRNIAYILGWSIVDQYVELYTQTVNRVGSLEAVTGPEIKATLESMQYAPLGLFEVDYSGGERRAVSGNRIAQMAFLNADGTGPATSAADAMLVPGPDGGQFFVPILIPLTPFEDAPDLRPGGADVP
jgi:hypothetical protein